MSGAIIVFIFSPKFQIKTYKLKNTQKQFQQCSHHSVFVKGFYFPL